MKHLIKTFKIFFLLFILTTLYLLLNTSQASAADMALGVFPPIIQIQALPPANITSPLSIENQGELPLKVNASFRLFKASEDGDGSIRFLSDKEGVPGANPFIFKDIQLTPIESGLTDQEHALKSFLLGPKQKKDLILHIGLPDKEPASDYYFSIVFQGVDATAKLGDEQDTENKSITTAGIATNVLLSIGPKGRANGILEEFSTPLFRERGPVPFTVRVRNTGNYYTTINGAITIKNMFGQQIGRVELIPVNILAGATRYIPDIGQLPKKTSNEDQSFSNNQGLTTNDQRPTALWPETFLFGFYRATLSMSLSEKGPFLTKNIVFLVFPFQIIIGLIILVILVVIVRKKVKMQLR